MSTSVWVGFLMQVVRRNSILRVQNPVIVPGIS